MQSIILKAAMPIALNARPREQLAKGDMSPIEGWAAKYGQEIERWWGFMELAAGAFAESLDKPSDVRILSQHDPTKPVGIATEFRDSNEGLYMKAAINTDVMEGRELMSLIQTGVLTAFSVGFDVQDVAVETRGEGRGKYEVEKVTRATLRECSVVTFPALSDAKITEYDDSESAPGPGRVRPIPPNDYSAAADACRQILAA